MKKIFLSGLVLFFAAHSFASVSIRDTFTFNSKFKRNDLNVTVGVLPYLSIGAEGSLNNTEYYDDNIYSFLLPVNLNLDFVNLRLTPFYVPEVDNGPKAAGGIFSVLINMQSDEIQEVATQGFLTVAYANQKAVVAKGAAAESLETYEQLVYTLGLRQNYFNLFYFVVNGSLFHYPSGITNMTSYGSVLDQNYLGDTGSYDTVLGLPKVTGTLKLFRGFENKSNIYLAYSYTEFYLTPNVHSMILGNEFPLGKNWWIDMAYNHTIDRDSKKRDFFRLGARVKF